VTLETSLEAFDPATGALRWQTVLPGLYAVTTDVIVDGPYAFVLTSPTNGPLELLAIDTTGYIVWAVSPPGFVSTPVADGHTVYVFSQIPLTNPPNTFDDLLIGYRESNGGVASATHPALFTGAGAGGVSSVGFSGGLIYGVQDRTHGLSGVGAFSMRPDTGAIVQSFPSSTRFLAIGAGVSVWAVDALFQVLDPSTGASLWNPPTTVTADPTIAGNLVYYGDADNLVIANARDGTPAGSVKPVAGETVEAITPSGGRVFVATAGTLSALAPSS
jgi:hypothetical protein